MRLPEQISLRPSRALAIALAAVHCGGGACLLPLPLPIWCKLALGAALAGSLALAMRASVLLRAARSIVQLVINGDGTLDVLQKDGVRHNVQVTVQTTVFSVLAAITFEVAGERGTRAIVILPDMVDSGQFRRLRVWLRWRTEVSRGAA